MAAGPKIIAEELLKDADKAIHALDYAHGCDLFDYDDWQTLHTEYEAIASRLRAMLTALPSGTYEQIMTERYGSQK